MLKDNNKKVVIIGGGPAGLTAAYDLSKAGIETIVLEKDNVVGGISRTVKYKGFHFDIGGHRFFTKVKSVDEKWREVIGENFMRRNRLSRIYYNKKFFYYPLRAANAFLGLGIYKSIMIVISYIFAQIFPQKPEDSFETWVSNRFGKYLYSIFFKNYTEKVWGIPCTEISADWAAQRIKGLSLVSAVKNALIAQKGNNQEVITTLIDKFDYPKKGPGMMWEGFSDAIQKKGNQVRMNTLVDKIIWKDNKVSAVQVSENGQAEILEGTNFISSMPIGELIQGFDPPAPQKVRTAAEKLNYRDFLTVVLIIDQEDVFPDNWIYVHDPDVKVGRLQNYKNWSPYMVPDQKQTCLGLEYFCFEGDELWNMADQDLIELGKKELEILGFAIGNDVKDGAVVRMPKTYPVYDADYVDSVQTIRNFLNSIDNLQPVGRNGMHRYNNMDHSMLTAMMASENIMGAGHDLWSVNADQEYHEEVYKEEKEISENDKAFLRSFARIDKLGLAAALGSVSGLLVFLATLILTIKGGENTGQTLQLLNNYFIGYTVTLKGAFIGFGYSFTWGFLVGWIFAYFRNLIVAAFIFRVKRRLELLTFKDFLDHF